ncbi:hypothetical protein D5086_008806 [Populus alba]|uniref:Uncharacterized protein n=1 Tax=Populus alba TaxID=43335 RepID=A0ACC4CGU7_POPAL
MLPVMRFLAGIDSITDFGGLDRASLTDFWGRRFTFWRREDDLVIDFWFANGRLPPDYRPLELCNPGLCSPRSSTEGEFVFHASSLNELDLTSSFHILGMLIEYPQLALGIMWAPIIFLEAMAQRAQISNHNRFSAVGLLLISASGCVLQ